MTRIDSCAAIEFTQKIFQGARTALPETFQDWVLEQLKNLIPFDSAKWVTGSVLNNEGVAHSIHLFNQPNELMYNCFPREGTDDPLLAKLLARPGHTLNLYDVIPREQWIQLEVYKNYCKPYGIEQAISTAIPNTQTGLLTVLSIYRTDVEFPFSPEEIKLKKAISPALADARNLNLFLHLNPSFQDASSASAICDNKGVLREAEPAFSELMLKEWPIWKGPELHFSPEKLLGNNQQAQFQGHAITINIISQQDLVLLQARKKNCVDMLTPAEKNIMQHLMRGLTNKEIAHNLSISPKTVSHHLQSIYRKTGVSNRKQAIVQLKGV